MTKSFGYSIISTVGVQQAGMAQSVAHLIGSEEVTGSIPVASFIKKVDFTRKMEDLRKRKPPEKRWFFVPDYYLTTIKIFLLIFKWYSVRINITKRKIYACFIKRFSNVSAATSSIFFKL